MSLLRSFDEPDIDDLVVHGAADMPSTNPWTADAAAHPSASLSGGGLFSPPASHPAGPSISLKLVRLDHLLSQPRGGERGGTALHSVNAKGGLRWVCVNSRCFMLGFLNGELWRWCPDDNTLEMIELGDRQEASVRLSISRIFVDPKGYHTLITLANGDNWYLNYQSSRARSIGRLRGHFIECVAWDRSPTQTNTREILIGTKGGTILEAVIEQRKEVVKTLFELPKKSPVVDIFADVLPNAPTVQADAPAPASARRLLVIAVSTRYLYTFMGTVSSYEQLFNKYASSAPGGGGGGGGGGGVGVDEMDALTYEVGRDLSHGELLIASGPGRHMEFFWMSGAGVLHTSLLPSPTPPYSILSPPVVLPYPPSPSPPLFVSPTSVSQGATTSAVQSAPMVHRSNTGATDAELKLLPVPPPAPKSMALTNHHLLMLYDERLLVVSRITFERVTEHALPAQKYGMPRRLLKDAFDGTLWLYSELYLYEIILTNEDTNIWKLYLKKGEYDSALRHCRTTEQRDGVICRHAQTLFDQKQYTKAAQKYAQTRSRAFESICLQFMQAHQEAALLEFLKAKFQQLRQGGQDSAVATQPPQQNAEPASAAQASPQEVMLFVWMVEIYVHQLNVLDAHTHTLRRTLAHNRGGGGGEGGSPSTFALPAATPEELESLQKQSRAVRDELCHLLRDFRHVDEVQSTVYHLLNSQSRPSELLFYAEQRKDLETLLLHHIHLRQYRPLLKRLAAFEPGALRDAQLHRFAPLLFHYEPTEFVNLCMQPSFKSLDPTPLVPVLLRGRASGTVHRFEAIRLLEHFLDMYHASQRLKGRTAEEDSREHDEAILASLGLSLPATNGGEDHDSRHQHPGRQREAVCGGGEGQWKDIGGVFNALVVLYAEDESDKDEAALIRLLAAQKGVSCLPFDGPFALRYCEERGKHRAAVMLYGMMGRHQEAVDKALAMGDLELAKHNACRPGDGEKQLQLRKRLWLSIVEHQAQRQDVLSLRELMHDSGGLLRIQDLLPYMSDTILIDSFKEDICESLDDYERKIQQLKAEMEEHRKAASQLKDDLRSVNQRCTLLSATQPCDLCQHPLFAPPPPSTAIGPAPSRPPIIPQSNRHKVYAFPCGHAFHAVCCQSLVYPTLSIEARHLMDYLASQMRELVSKGSLNAAQQAQLARMETDVDDVLAEECPICGNLMVKSVLQPLVLPEENPEDLSWRITSPPTPSSASAFGGDGHVTPLAFAAADGQTGGSSRGDHSGAALTTVTLTSPSGQT